MDCLFCKMVNGEINTKIIHQDDNLIVIDDIHPIAPFHKLIIPKKHIANINDINPENASIIGQMVLAAKEIAVHYEFAKSGYRLVFNCNEDGGQTVFHLHLHVLGGRYMQWPPG